jgi:uncharacterized small protein (DUF1192 family)
MLTEDDEPRPKPRFTPLPLDRLGVEELEAYIDELRGEIARTEAEMARKRHMRSAADSFFKRP